MSPTNTATLPRTAARSHQLVAASQRTTLDPFEYVDWSDYPNGMDYFRKLKNLVVLRTYSKIYGLAGVRLGYGIMQRELTRYLHRTRMPFNVSSIAQAACTAEPAFSRFSTWLRRKLSRPMLNAKLQIASNWFWLSGA